MRLFLIKSLLMNYLYNVARKKLTITGGLFLYFFMAR